MGVVVGSGAVGVQYACRVLRVGLDSVQVHHHHCRRTCPQSSPRTLPLLAVRAYCPLCPRGLGVQTMCVHSHWQRVQRPLAWVRVPPAAPRVQCLPYPRCLGARVLCVYDYCQRAWRSSARAFVPLAVSPHAVPAAYQTTHSLVSGLCLGDVWVWSWQGDWPTSYGLCMCVG